MKPFKKPCLALEQILKIEVFVNNVRGAFAMILLALIPFKIEVWVFVTIPGKYSSFDLISINFYLENQLLASLLKLFKLK